MSGILDPANLRALLRPMAQCLREQRRAVRAILPHVARKRQIDRYFVTHSVRKLQLGTSDKLLDGWLNTDVDRWPGCIYLDATQRFPIDDGTLDFVFCEHFIEHVDQRDGAFCMREVYRCLKPGGVFRVATPNLDRYLTLFDDSASDASAAFLEQFRTFYRLPTIDPAIALNHFMCNIGHRFVYTSQLLRSSLEAAGFLRIESQEVGQSSHAVLTGIERHAEFYGDALNRYETMIFEATK